ncbi:hypothetical protein LQG66_35220 [Bradyrhizobium ontarionense]|uniref:Uncharacterized protein n=1 Tax=Bradyrhizobium ontarionense TaxID=2898149 RepID=A0ABY3RAV5_9BRAD|nr:hypothetical protein [Bradyrhizobium sp. A19]UFZ04378.1 hypothetical protein LQG66_35220 [Bradyrhizobium sp. A19]
MYFLTVCLVVIILSTEVSFRRSSDLSRNSRWAAPAKRIAARRRALWPALCAAIFGLGLIGFEHVQDKQDFTPSATTHLMMLTVSFFGGRFLGVIGRMDFD